jgi:hypothetical protein
MVWGVYVETVIEAGSLLNHFELLVDPKLLPELL